MGPLRLKSTVLAFCLLSLGCSDGRPARDADAAQGDATATPDAIAFADAPGAPPDSSCPLGTTAGIPLPIRVACERGQWCWESPNEYGFGYSDALIESPTSVWLAGIEPGALMHFDGTAWRLVQLDAALPLTTFSEGLRRGRWVWGTRFVGANGETALFRRNSTGWEPASLPNHETPRTISDSDWGTIVVTNEWHVFVMARDATEWSELHPPLADRIPRDACVSTNGEVFVASSRGNANNLDLWKSSSPTSSEWIGTTMPSSVIGLDALVCPRAGSVLTASYDALHLDEPGKYHLVHWTAPSPIAYPPARLLFERRMRETTAGDTIVGDSCWTPDGLVSLNMEMSTSWIDTDPTRQVTLRREDVAPRVSAPATSVLIDAFEDGSPLFAVYSTGVRMRTSSGEWITTDREALGGERIFAASVASRNVVWLSQSNGILRRIEFDANGTLVQRGERIASPWTATSPSIAFDETDRGWAWTLPTASDPLLGSTTGVQRWTGSAFVGVSIGGNASAITTDGHGGLWVITEDMHVRRCREMRCEDTGRTLPFPQRSAINARAAVNDTLWVASASNGLVALAATGAPRTVANINASRFYVARDGTAFIQTAPNRIVHLRSDGTTIDETRAPKEIDALYATSAGALWVNTASTNQIASRQP